jgi:hypothetical protein
VASVGVSVSGEIKYAQTGLSNGSNSVIVPASWGLTVRNPRAKKKYGKPICTAPKTIKKQICCQVGVVSQAHQTVTPLHSNTASPMQKTAPKWFNATNQADG